MLTISIYHDHSPSFNFKLEHWISPLLNQQTLHAELGIKTDNLLRIVIKGVSLVQRHVNNNQTNLKHWSLIAWFLAVDTNDFPNVCIPKVPIYYSYNKIPLSTNFGIIQSAFTFSKLTIETLEQGVRTYLTLCSSVSVVNFEHVIAEWEFLRTKILKRKSYNIKIKIFKKI